MIAYLRGTVAARSEDSAVIDVGGVGYLVLMPDSHVRALADGEETCVHVYTYVREDQLTLFGFADATSRAVFGKLIGLSKVGPRLALSVLSTFDLAELREVAYRSNIALLKRIPGVGTKTAERLALELKDLLEGLDLPLPSAATPGASAAGAVMPKRAPVFGVWDEARSALGNLGYVEQEVDATLGLVREEDPGLDHLDSIIRRGLALLRKR